MNTETKRHIDSARQVLVGVVPNPTSQIDQITNALIYKFMDDMDQASIKQGGEPAFFVGNLEPYAWTRLMDSRMGNQERMNLYGEALIKFSQAKQLPELFRDIFKSAFLPYRSPETLGLFLKEIDYFDYSHPEELGNAYEYLLSIMSSQGDAGQFRTPRHIIDFIVDVVNPTKGDKVLDPACGTGGFLVSSYKHILEQHDGKDDPKKKEKPLTPDERKKLMANFEGYDIDPTMVRIAQVNMYLHQFKNPKIFQYDTLSSEERWNDKFDVILANPPFMSPKGGIKPHSKFSVPSSRSEVLFVDYIMNHLRPKGRAGIIVPEGIIFQSGTAHKQLRKNLVEDGLYAVVSLPSGVFAPYSGVKTSILLFDNEVAKRSQEILFVKIENDGLSLGAQRRAVDKNDLPEALEVFRKYQEAIREGRNFSEEVKGKSKDTLQIEQQVKAKLVLKKLIAESGDYNLSGDRYTNHFVAHVDPIKLKFTVSPVTAIATYSKWPMVKFDDVVSTLAPPAKIPKEHFKTVGSFPIIDQSQDEISGWTNDEAALVKSEKPLVIFGDHTCAVKYTEKPFAQGADGIKILLTSDQLIPKYFYYILKTKPVELEGYQRHFSKLKRYKIPLPPLEVQEQIVAELDGYAGIIAGAKQIVQNWKPVFIQDANWELQELSDVADFQEGPGIMAVDFQKEGAPLVRLKGLTDNFANLEGCNFLDPRKVEKKWSHFKLKLGDLLLSTSGSLGKVSEVGSDLVGSIAYTGIIRFRPKNQKIDVEFLKYFLMSEYFINQAESASTGVTLKHFGPTHLNKMEIMVPPITIQKQIVERIKAERVLVESAKKLIAVYEQKTKDTIAKLWSE